MRGFDIFMKACKRIVTERSDVIILIAGTDRIAYGGALSTTPAGSRSRIGCLPRDQYDLSRIKFLGRVDPFELAKMLASGDLHIYLTVPFVLSWSMMDALSCGAVVLGSDTAPIREMITDGQNGLLANFFEPDEFAVKAMKVLDDPCGVSTTGPRGRADDRGEVQPRSGHPADAAVVRRRAKHHRRTEAAARVAHRGSRARCLHQGSHPNQPMAKKPPSPGGRADGGRRQIDRRRGEARSSADLRHFFSCLTASGGASSSSTRSMLCSTFVNRVSTTTIPGIPTCIRVNIAR